MKCCRLRNQKTKSEVGHRDNNELVCGRDPVLDGRQIHLSLCAQPLGPSLSHLSGRGREVGGSVADGSLRPQLCLARRLRRREDLDWDSSQGLFLGALGF